MNEDDAKTEKDVLLAGPASTEDGFHIVELRKDPVESNISDISNNQDQEFNSRRDEDSDESTLLDPTSSAGLGTLERNEELSIGNADPDELCPQRPSYCTGCSPLRILMAPMAAIVLGLVGLTYYAYVLETPDVTIPELCLFHILIVLLLGYSP